jgi:putative transposase
MELVGARQDVAFVIEKFDVSERRACELNHIDRSSYRYQPMPDRNADLRGKLTALARERPRWGYRRLGVLLEKKGDKVNPKRLFRVYQQAGLAVRRRERKRLERGAATMPLFVRPNQEWSMDFVSDALANGRALRALTVVDNFTKEAPVIEVDCSLSAPRITRVLDEVIEDRGTPPEGIRIDNGPEFTSRCFLAWAEQRGIRLVHIQPGKPTQNSFIESFNGRFRDECLNANWFANLADAKSKIEAWRVDYNQHRPHSSLAYRTPAEFARVWPPSPCATVIEQTGEPVKDSLTARKTSASLTGSPACSKAPHTRMKGRTEGVML